MSKTKMTSIGSRISIWNSPRMGGPLRWSRDLRTQINTRSQYQAKLVTNPVALVAGLVFPQADLIHAAVPVTYRLWRRPLVLTVKGDYTIEKNIWRRFYPQAIRMADIVTVPSRYLIDRIPELSHARVIPNAVDLHQFSVSQPPKSDQFNILVVTNFWFPEKARGVEQLLSLLQRALPGRKALNCQVTVVGDGAFLEKVKQRTKQFQFKVIYTGWSDPRIFFPATNLFLYYSYHDNMPNAVLEAMAAGLPILTNLVGAIPEMIQHERDGLIAQDDDNYIELLTDLIMNESRRHQLSQGARERVKTDFSWERVIVQYLNLYKNLLN